MANQPIIERSVTCPNCNNPLRPEARFCPRCGYALPAVVPEQHNALSGACDYCGAAYRTEAKFCPSCGRTVVDATPPPLQVLYHQERSATPPAPVQYPDQTPNLPFEPSGIQRPPVYSPPAWDLTPAPAAAQSYTHRPINRLLIAGLTGLIVLVVVAITLIFTMVDKPVPPAPTPNVAATLTAAAQSLAP
jgi:RNA polymerase subunit RPABC4/transcription elongation factor Spt4